MGWSLYSILSLIFLWLIMRRWPVEFVINSAIYAVSGIILTHLLRGRMKQWRAVGDQGMTSKILVSVLAIAVIQALLITANILVFEGPKSSSISVRSIATSIVSAAVIAGAWTGAYFAFSQSRRELNGTGKRRMVRDV